MEEVTLVEEELSYGIKSTGGLSLGTSEADHTVLLEHFKQVRSI